MTHVGGHHQQGGKCLCLFGSLIMICTALNIIVSVNINLEWSRMAIGLHLHLASHTRFDRSSD